VRRATRALGIVVSLVLAACSGGPAGSADPVPSSSPPSPPAASPSVAPSVSGPASTVRVTLGEWSVATDVGEVPAGTVTFEVSNAGPDRAHEFVVLRTDIAPDDLPTDLDAAAIETTDGVERVGKIDAIPVGETGQLTLGLSPGRYVLLCNINDAVEEESHYQFGMRTGFTVRD
jgi:uncharacterized cupredoxin-like copper-binding protein